jgi:hypothetical protein
MQDMSTLWLCHAEICTGLLSSNVEGRLSGHALCILRIDFGPNCCLLMAHHHVCLFACLLWERAVCAVSAVSSDSAGIPQFHQQ